MRRLVGGLALAALIGAAGLATAQAQQDGREREVIAKAISNGFAVRVTAERDRLDGEPDTATVRIAAFERKDGGWERMRRPLRVGLASGWFWNVVTEPTGVRRLQLVRRGGECPERVALRLLVSPSIGPSATYRFAVCDGRFHQVDV